MKKNRPLQSISIISMLIFAQPMVGSLLHKAAEEGNRESVQQLLEEGTDKDTRDKWRETALHKAASHGHTKIVELLISAKADIEARDTFSKTALHHAALDNKTEWILLLAITILLKYENLYLCKYPSKALLNNLLYSYFQHSGAF